jgi:Cu/Ag efflux pump CusA
VLLCIEKRLDWELEGVRVAFEVKVTGDDCGLAV